jgi:hypothetical protein
LTNGKSGLIFDIFVQSPKNFKKAGRSIFFFRWGVAMKGKFKLKQLGRI